MVDANEGHEGYCRVKLEATAAWTNCTDPLFTSVPFDTDVAMEKIFVIGNRNAVDTVEGVLEITGSVERPYFQAAVDNDFIDGSHSLADVCGLYGGNVSKCSIAIAPNPNFTYVLHSVKFHSYSLGVAAQEITTERADFSCDNISTS